MRRLTAIALMILAPAVLAAVPTTTVTGKVALPSGSVATGGTISCTLVCSGTPCQGSALDGSTNVRIAGSATGTISALGVPTGLALVGNDLITPAGTQYQCKITASGPIRTAWTEPNWTIASSPSTIDIGAISRPGVTPLTIAGITGSAGTLVTSNGVGAPAAATGVTATSASGGTLTVGGPLTVTGATGLGSYTYTSSNSQDLDGDGTAAGAYLTGALTTSESGQYISGTIRLDRLYTPRATVDNVGVHESNIVAARAHAARYSTNPDRYLMGGVYDYSTDLGLDSPWVANTHSVQDTLYAGAPNNGDTSALCLATNSTSIATKDVVLIGAKVAGTPTGRGHLVWAVTVSDARCGGNKVGLDVYPGVRASENASGASISTTWTDSGHFVPEMYWAIGNRLGYAPLARDGVQGRDALTNGATDMYGTVPQGWQAVTGTLGAHGWTNTFGTSANTCREGNSTAYSCFDISGDSTSYLVSPARTDSPAWINVTPGEFWTASGWLKGCLNNDKLELETDYNNDGTYEHSVDITADGTVDLPSMTFTSNDSSYDCTWWKPIFKTWRIPDGVHQVRLSFKRAGATALYLDNFTFRKVDTPAADDSTAVTQYLINDPGSRCIAIVGDSHAVDYGDANGDGTLAVGDGNGSFMKTGLAAALNARFGRDISSQIYVRGKSGITAANLLTSNTCNHTSATTGALNCWYESVEGVDCLYYIVDISTVNDLASSVTRDSWIASIQAIKAGIMRLGGIPIFLTPAPYGTVSGNPANEYDVTKDYNASHQLKQLTIRTLLNPVP